MIVKLLDVALGVVVGVGVLVDMIVVDFYFLPWFCFWFLCTV